MIIIKKQTKYNHTNHCIHRRVNVDGIKCGDTPAFVATVKRWCLAKEHHPGYHRTVALTLQPAALYNLLTHAFVATDTAMVWSRSAILTQSVC